MLTGPNSISLTISCFNGMMIFFICINIIYYTIIINITVKCVINYTWLNYNDVTPQRRWNDREDVTSQRHWNDGERAGKSLAQRISGESI